MHRTIWLLLALIILGGFTSACLPQPSAVATAAPVPPTAAGLAGKWKSEYGFYVVFDAKKGTFSGSNDEQAAAEGQGIVGTFALAGDELTLVEDDGSLSCPGLEGRFTALLSDPNTLRLTIVDDPCIYRVEGLFQGGQGGHRLLEFSKVRE